jgi:hypothetical protein
MASDSCAEKWPDVGNAWLHQFVNPVKGGAGGNALSFPLRPDG